jgi:flagellar motor switch protein FliG
MNAPTGFSNAKRAAILVMIMDDAQAAEILRGLEPHELRLIGQAMCELQNIPPSHVAATIGGFLKRTHRQGLFTPDPTGRVRDLMTMALGEKKSDSVMARIAPATKTSSLEIV